MQEDIRHFRNLYARSESNLAIEKYNGVKQKKKLKWYEVVMVALSFYAIVK